MTMTVLTNSGKEDISTALSELLDEMLSLSSNSFTYNFHFLFSEKRKKVDAVVIVDNDDGCDGSHASSISSSSGSSRVFPFGFDANWNYLIDVEDDEALEKEKNR